MLTLFRSLSRNTVTLAITNGLVLTGYFAWTPLLALYLRDLGANELQVGAAFSAFTLAHALPALLGGVLADRIGRKWVSTAPSILLAPLFLLSGLAHDWLIVTVILTAGYVLSALQWPAMQAMISESDEERRAAAFSFVEIFVLGAAIIGPLVGSLLLPVLGVGGLLIFQAVFMIPASIIRVLQLRDTQHAAPQTKIQGQSWRSAMSSTVIWIIVANIFFALVLGLTFEGPFAALLANDIWKLDLQQIQWLNSLGGLAALLGVWLGGKADHWDGRKIWILCAVAMAGALIGWGLSGRWEIGILFYLASNICYEAIFLVGETLLAQHTTRASRSSAFGLMLTVGGFSTAAGPTLGAWAVSLSSLAAPFLIAAVSSLLSIGFLLRVGEQKEADAGEIVPEEFVAGQLVE